MKNCNIKNLIYLVNSSFRNKSYNLTSKLLNEIIKSDNTSYKAYCLLGYIIFIKSENNIEKLKQAIKYFDTSIKLQKYYPLSYYYRIKSKKKLIKIYNKENLNIKKEIKSDIAQLKKLANNYLIKNIIRNFLKNPLGIQNKKTLILKNIEEIKDYMINFNTQKVKYDYSDIIENYNYFIETNNNIKYDLHNLRGFIKFNLNIYDEALEDFNTSINHKYSDGYYNRAKLKYKLREYSEALRDFKKAKQIFMRESSSNVVDRIKCDHYIAWCNYKLNNIDIVFDDIEVDDIIEDNSLAYYNIGKLKLQFKKYDEAYKYFSKIDKDCRNYKKAKYYIQACEYRMNNNYDDIEFLENILKLLSIYKEENDFGNVNNLGSKILEHIKRFDKKSFNYNYYRAIALYYIYEVGEYNKKLKRQLVDSLKNVLIMIEEKRREYYTIKKMLMDLQKYGI
ncbi:tetratricopeptide repeat protein [uncultured Brachyspira sp.]|uniref:tetratricopeptide repeat protein n=1 Tax=uncultured Brachyspira sp. TaxID=221953 RepID=UPI0025DA7DE9|nr:tetratricopeptide repeat protein [uncultured Brachyspira sp.]